MLNDLMQMIETLKARITKHRDALGNSESRTRVALIDPMLRALGWDVADPDVVEIEPNVANGWADYALLDGNRKPVIFVEAKKLSVVKPPVLQTVSYAVTENTGSSRKVHYCAWTNGDAWEVFDVFAQDSVMKVSITKEDAAKCALQFLSLWRPSLQDGGFERAIEPLVYVDNVPPAQSPVDPEPILPSSTQAGWVPLDGEFATTNATPPSAVRFPDGEERPTRYWISVLAETARWLHRTGMLTQGNCPIKTVRSQRYLLSRDGKHQDGRDFKFRLPIGEGIVLEGSRAAPDSIRQAQFLLKHFGKDPSRVAIRLQ